jgi:hypothetical protein
VRAAATALRKLVRAADPALDEAGYPGWRCIAYRHPAAGYVCAIFPTPDAARLLFEHGVRLPDPLGLLEGAGRQTRYLEFRDASEVAAKAAIVTLLVREAVALRA